MPPWIFSLTALPASSPGNTPARSQKSLSENSFQQQGYSLNQNTEDNWPLYRYADVLLMLAESQ